MSFDVAAEAYDSFMGRFSEPLAVSFAAWCGLQRPAHALDVGCGTGALTRVLTDRLGERAVTAVDPSDSFVTAARARFPAVDIRQAGAELLPFPDDAFDAALAELVVHFMTDPAAGVHEMVRVTRPGGLVAACVWDFVGGRAPQTRFFSALRRITPDTEDETGRTGGRRGDLGRLLRAAGCDDVEEGKLSVEVGFEGFDGWWEPYTHGVAPAGRQLAALPGPDRERVRQEARRLVPDRPFTIRATAWTGRGRAPRG